MVFKIPRDLSWINFTVGHSGPLGPLLFLVDLPLVALLGFSPSLRLDPVGHSGPLGLLRVLFLSLLTLCGLGVGHSGPLSPLLPLYLFSLLFSLLLHHCLDSVGHSGPLGLWQPPLSSLLLPSPFFI